MKDRNGTTVEVGDTVDVYPNDESIVPNEFRGTIVAVRGEYPSPLLVSVRDQDDDVFDCEFNEIEFVQE